VHSTYSTTAGAAVTTAATKLTSATYSTTAQSAITVQPFKLTASTYNVAAQAQVSTLAIKHTTSSYAVNIKALSQVLDVLLSRDGAISINSLNLLAPMGIVLKNPPAPLTLAAQGSVEIKDAPPVQLAASQNVIKL